MNELTVFTNPEFGEIRSLEIDGEPWLVGKDVAQALGYNNTRKAIIDHVDEEDKMDGVTIRDAIGREQNPVLINESGLYSLIFSSQLPDAKKFKRWVTSEVLPSIRRTGGYMASEVARQLESVQKDFSSRLASIYENLARQSADIKKLEIKLEEAQKTAARNPQTWRSDCFDMLKPCRGEAAHCIRRGAQRKLPKTRGRLSYATQNAPAQFAEPHWQLQYQRI